LISQTEILEAKFQHKNVLLVNCDNP